jgi:diaminopimelate epimerase
MRFVKMHGLGNDYVYVDGFDEHVGDPAALARRITDRHTGVGGDGLILLLPAEPGTGADVRMRMFNADGHESEMCGNGIRCLCKLAYERGRSRNNPMRIQTGRGVLAVRFALDGAGRVESATVDMGEPILVAAQIPVRLGDRERVVDAPMGDVIRWPEFPGIGAWRSLAGLDERLTCVSMGNPHAILYCKDVAQVPLELVGPLLERHPIFPNRTNVHFVQVLGTGEVKVRTWERGSGITLACGTGAAAVCVGGVLTNRSSRRLQAHMPGGPLDLDWSEKDNHVSMTGPAVAVFAGEWPD